MNINYQKLSLLVITLFAGNILAETKYYEQLDPFTDKKVFYMYNESINNDSFTRPAFFKIGLTAAEGNWILAFNSEYWGIATDTYETVDVMVRFDKNPPFSIDALYCDQFGDLDDCLVHDNDRDPSFGLFTVDYQNFIQRFLTELMSSEKLIIKFPEEQPYTFDLKGTMSAITKFDSNFVQ